MFKDICNHKEIRKLREKYDVNVGTCGYNNDTIHFCLSFGRDSSPERDDIAQAMIAKDKNRVTRLESWNTASEDQDPKDCPSVYVVTSEIPNNEKVTIDDIEERMKLMYNIFDDWKWRNEETIKARVAFWEKHKNDWP